jgi:hypothetical protein
VQSGTGWVQEAKLVASDPSQQARFGTAVAMGEDTVIVGSPGADSPTLPNTGAVYVFERSGTTWVERQKLVAGDPTPSGFGHSVALEDGRAVIGAWGDSIAGLAGSGSAYVFERSAAAWAEVQKLVPGDPMAQGLFGADVALAGDTVLIGAYGGGAYPFGPGSAYVFARHGSTWSEEQKLVPSGGGPTDVFGWSVALAGDTALIGAARYSPGAPIWPGGLAWDPGSGTLYASADGVLAEVDPERGFATIVGTIGFDDVLGLEFDPATGVLYGSDNTTDQLVRIDPGTGAGTAVGPLGFERVNGLALDPVSGTLYGVDDDQEGLITIDPSTGKGSWVGFLGFDNVAGLAFDPVGGVLHGSDMLTDQLLSIDPATGSASAVGSLGFDKVRGLAFDPLSGTLYGTDSTDIGSYYATSAQLLQIDTSTGAGASVGVYDGWFAGTVYLFSRSGTSWSERQKLLASDATPGDSFGWSMALSGDTALIGAFYDDIAPVTVWFSQGHGSAYSFRLSPGAPETYCTAGTSASGCRALFSASGTASASAPSGFVLTATGAEGARNGAFLLGNGGHQANPWGNGTSYQCIVPPAVSAGVLPGAGALGTCDGAFAQDLNALWCPSCPKAALNPGFGASVQAQLWYRDPFSTSNQTTSLSDAIEFAVGQ